MTKLQALQDKYFDKLEEDGIEFIQYDDIGNYQSEAVLKPEYDVSVKEMREYLGQDTSLPEEIHEEIDSIMEFIDRDDETKETLRRTLEYLYNIGASNGRIEQINKKTKKHLDEATGFMLEQTGLALNYN